MSVLRCTKSVLRSGVRSKEDEEWNDLYLTMMHCFKYINITQLHSQLFMLMGGQNNLNKA